MTLVLFIPTTLAAIVGSIVFPLLQFWQYLQFCLLHDASHYSSLEFDEVFIRSIKIIELFVKLLITEAAVSILIAGCTLLKSAF